MERPTKEILKLVPLFSKFDDESLTKLESFIEEKHYKSGEILFHENSYGDTFYIIKKGAVEIYKEGENGEEKVILAMRRSGDFFGEMALIQNDPRFATARIATDTQMLELSKPAFISLLYELPIVAFEIMGVLASRLREADTQMIKDLKEKNESLEKLSADLEESNRRLNRTKKFLERIISVSPYTVVVTDKKGKVFIFNQAAREVYGYHIDEVMEKNLSVLRSPNCPMETIQEMKEKLENNDTFSGELIDMRKNGDEFIHYVTACNIDGPGGKVLGILFLGTDITESKELERQAQSLDRMAARGQMAAEVAHELNNYISVLSGNLELLPIIMGDSFKGDVEAKVEVMRKSVERMTMFTSGLMSFNKPRYDFTQLEINKFLEGELAFLRPQKRFRKIQINSSFDERVGSIEADPGGLQQILFNLINNAADALNNEGRSDGVITIKTEPAEDEEFIIMSVADNGPGMSEDDVAKAFRQSFTTKSSGHGFGLTTIKSIAKAHGGNAKVESESGKGTTFYIKLPFKQQRPHVPAEASSPPGKQTVNTSG
ncbi:MAG: cyclic nucleotide-binding domain-containing protein [candidate division Zixibacteria bacterium]|nr:cyclic nucleotide-binding domain-containing protein [candidate division Zixibacteria bacterium]